MGDCHPANVTADDLIESFEADVQLLIVTARSLVGEVAPSKYRNRHGPRIRGRRLLDDPAEAWVQANGVTVGSGEGGCGQRESLGRQQHVCCWGASQVAELDKAIGALPKNGVERVSSGRSRFSFYFGPTPHWLLWAFTLAFAYHKLIPVCSKADPVVRGGTPMPKPDWRCTEEQMDEYVTRVQGGMDHDGQIAYDILPIDPTLGYCSGELCRQATAAIDGYRNLLHVITPFRTALLGALVQKKCPYDAGGVFVAQLARLNRELPGVVAAMRAARAGLVAKCIAPSRRLGTERMARVDESA
jgi:hypothetical protein